MDKETDEQTYGRTDKHAIMYVGVCMCWNILVHY